MPLDHRGQDEYPSSDSAYSHQQSGIGEGFPPDRCRDVRVRQQQQQQQSTNVKIHYKTYLMCEITLYVAQTANAEQLQHYIP
jgi:hypothetical protein